MSTKHEFLVAALGQKPRHHWSDTFKIMAEQGDDAPLLNEDDCTSWDKSEWEW